MTFSTSKHTTYELRSPRVKNKKQAPFPQTFQQKLQNQVSLGQLEARPESPFPLDLCPGHGPELGQVYIWGVGKGLTPWNHVD